MKRLAIPALGFILSMQPAVAAGTKEQFAKAFNTWCGTGVPSFDAVNKKASEKHLRLDNEMNPPMADGNMIDTRTWANADQTGTYAVNASRAVNGRRHVQGCGVYFPGLYEDLTDYLSEALALGKPYKRTVADDGKHLSYWNGPAHTMFMLTSGPTGGLKGATLNSIQTLELDR